jgi:hypothetical protein
MVGMNEETDNWQSRDEATCNLRYLIDVAERPRHRGEDQINMSIFCVVKKQQRTAYRVTTKMPLMR